MTNDPGFELGNDGPSVVLTAVDGSLTSLRAGAYAAGLARRQGAELVVLTVTTTPSLSAMVPDAVTALTESAEALGREVEDEARRALARMEIVGEFVHLRGDPYLEIVRTADELRADAVMVGASTKAGHRLVGSLALRLVKAGKWPVTVVP